MFVARLVFFIVVTCVVTEAQDVTLEHVPKPWLADQEQSNQHHHDNSHAPEPHVLAFVSRKARCRKESFRVIFFALTAEWASSVVLTTVVVNKIVFIGLFTVSQWTKSKVKCWWIVLDFVSPKVWSG